MTKSRPFLLSATVDFPDDCWHIVFHEDLLAQLIGSLLEMGVRRVYWIYWGRANDGMWQVFADRMPAVRPTLVNLGEPIAVARRLTHKQGLEFYAIIKPYETGESTTHPEGSAEATRRPGPPHIGGKCTHVDKWTAAHPDLRLRGRRADIPVGLDSIPVERIQLRQRDASPIRIRTENLEIWTSADNTGYRRRDVTYTLSESVEECPRDVFDIHGNPVARQGDPVRVLDVSGLGLLDPYIAITTNFDDDGGSFRNTAVEMVRAFGPGDQPLPIVVASHKALWRTPRNLRTGDLEYDGGIGDINVCLDVTNARTVCPHCREMGFTDCNLNPINRETQLCRDGVVAFARGRNLYLPTSPCEAYPEVQDYWLSWVGECIAAGVDGVDVRISNHSCWTDRPELYGFNQPVVAEYERRYGVNPDLEPYEPALLAALRGEYFDQFLRAVKRRLSTAGKRMQVHLEVESFRQDAPQARRRTRPGNISFNWRSWLRTGLADEATLKGVKWTAERILKDPVGLEMVQEATAAGVPLYLSHFNWMSRDGRVHADRLEYAYRFGGLSGFNLYETAALYDMRRLGSDGRLRFYPGVLEEIRNRVESLGLV